MVSSLKKIILKIYNLYSSNNLAESAAGLSYYMIFSIFPFSMVVYATLSLISFDTNEIESLFKILIPNEISKLIESFFTHLDKSGGISFLVLGIVLTIYTLTRYVKAYESRLNKIYGIKSRNTFKSWCIALIFSQLLLIAFYATVFVIIVGENFLEFLSAYVMLKSMFVKLYLFLRFFICAAIVFFTLLSLYYIIPTVKQKLKDILPGTTCVLIMWVILTLSFSYYMNNFSNYSVIYGTVGAFMILLLWLYFTNIILLSGAIINNHFFKKRTKQIDTNNIKYTKFDINSKERQN